MLAARLVEAFWCLFGALARCVVFTVLDGCEAVARRLR
jgi:hypothetical protein